MSLENSRYKITKNEDKLMLTDKKTLKSRILDVDDIDYVIDDNQKLRDSNIIENYFKLKDEPYEPKIMTKTADYVKEYKEAEKLYSNVKYEDIIDRFIKKHNLTDYEITQLAAVPDYSSIRAFSRTEEDKKTIINDFKNLQKALTEDKKIPTDVFTYLKAYFKNYADINKLIDEYDPKETMDKYVHNKKYYESDIDYKSIEDKNINSLADLYDNGKGIKTFNNINLDYLNNLLIKFNDICRKIKSYKERLKIVDNVTNTDLRDFINVAPDYNNLTSSLKTSEGIAGGNDKKFIEIYNKLGNNDKEIVRGILIGTYENSASNTNNGEKTNRLNETIKIYEKDLGKDAKELLDKISKEKQLKSIIEKMVNQIKVSDKIDGKEYDNIKNSYYTSMYKYYYDMLNNDEKKYVLDFMAHKKNTIKDLSDIKPIFEKEGKDKGYKNLISLAKELNVNNYKYFVQLCEKLLKEKQPTKDDLLMPDKKDKIAPKEEETKEEDEDNEIKEKIKENTTEIRELKTNQMETIKDFSNFYKESLKDLFKNKIYYMISIHNPLLNYMFTKINGTFKKLEGKIKYNSFYEFIETISAEGLNYFTQPYLIKIIIKFYESNKSKDDMYIIYCDYYHDNGNPIEKYNKSFTIKSGDSISKFNLSSLGGNKKTLENLDKSVESIINEDFNEKFEEKLKDNKYKANIKLKLNEITKEYVTDFRKRTEDAIDLFKNKLFKYVLYKINVKGESESEGYLKGNTIQSNLTGYGWTDDTLVRIENINKTLKEYKKAQGRIDPHLRNIIKYHPGNGRLALGIDGYAYGWTDDTLTRIERITDSLKMYSNGKLIGNGFIKKKSWTKPMYKQSAEGWTDDTLKRIEKISYTLDDY